MSTDPLDREDLRQRVQKALNGFVGGKLPVLDAISDELSPLTDALTDLVAGGKRLRPAFCYWGYRGRRRRGRRRGRHGGGGARAVPGLRAHPRRRHGRQRHPARAARRPPPLRQHPPHRVLDGDPEAFGVGAAVLLGDLCLSWSDEMLTTSGLPADRLAAGHRVYADMRTELMGGQYLDLLEQARGGGSIERALRVARYKSAKYTIEKPLHLGAALAGAEQAVLDGYSGYGLPLGEAFQLRDDVLGVFGDPSVTGKPAGDDLREGKRTAMVAMALEAADARQAAVVRRHLGDPHLTPDGVASLRSVLVETGAVERVERLIDELTGDALAALEAAPVEGAAREVLEQLATAVVRRSV
jgi:geranylgeranyl diphosphate synthase type I